MFREEFDLNVYINRKEYRQIIRAMRLTLKQDPNYDIKTAMQQIAASYRKGK
jgi:hypothetical protein